MKPNSKISAAVAAILSAPATTVVFAAPAETAEATAAGELATVTITAQRRAESLLDVPITVQAITGDQLEKLNVTNFNDVLKYTPNVTFSGNGPGTGNIFMRGLGGIGSGNQSQSTTAAFPNVAVYLDDQSMQFPARNNDVYVVDMERIEVLEGPQGTLFGGGAQAGAIRYITNKPNLAATTAEFSAGYGYTAHGTNNSQLYGILNVPLVNNTLAFRAVVFNEHQGGYINNVPSTIAYVPGTAAATTGGNPIGNNAYVVESDTNPVDYQGIRASLLWKFAPDWNFLLQQNYQDMNAHGYFYTYPVASNGQALNPYEIAAFTPAFNKDRYESTAWTLNGNFSDWNLVYTGSYLDRHIVGQQDYSNYLRSLVGSFYGCIGPGAGYFNSVNFPQLAGKPLQCYAPVGAWKDTVQNTHHSEELRLTSPPEYRLRGLLGAFYEKFVIYDQMDFNYLVIPQCDSANLAKALAGGPNCLASVGPVPGAFASNPASRVGINNAFGEDDQRGYKQTAFFISLDFDLIPKVLTITGGTRYFRYNDFEYGSEWYSESASPTAVATLINHPNGSCTQAGACGFPINLSKTETGWRSRGNLTWKITPDMMAYYTYSAGFRPGSFNRTNSSNGKVYLTAELPYTLPKDSTYQYLKPAGVNSDNLINNEVGFKSQLFDRHVLFNVSAYYMKWENIQLSLFDPAHLGNTTFNVNGPTYTIKGFEVQLAARITQGLTLDGSVSVNTPNQTVAPCLESVGVTSVKKTASNPTPAGQCITQTVNVATGMIAPYTNPFGQLNTRPAFSPPMQFNVRARYDWAAGAWKPFMWVGASHTSGMNNEPANFTPGDNNPSQNPPTTTLLLYHIPGWTTWDGALGVSKDQWTMQVHAENFTDAYGPTNISSGQYIKSEIPLRPRVVNFLISYTY